MCVCVCVCVSSVQKFARRSAVATTQEKEKYWKHLSLYYVTEESDDPENPNGIVEHHLPWRSESEFSGLLLSVLIRAFL